MPFVEVVGPEAVQRVGIEREVVSLVASKR